MLNQPFAASSDYFEIAPKPTSYSQSLWKVDDTELEKPGERFISDTSPYVDTVIERSISGPLESAPIPNGLIGFVGDAVRTFGAIPTRHSCIKEVMYCVMRWLDFDEFYFLLFDALVQQNCNQLNFTYRLKSTRAVLAPEKLECFNIRGKYEFPHYKACCEFMSHPSVKDALSGKVVMHQTKGKPIVKEDILEKLSTILYGKYEAVQSDVEGWIYRFYASQVVRTSLTDDELFNLDADQERDVFFWMVCTISALMWFKSPYAVRFLAEYHPIYAELIQWDEKQGKVVLVPESGGEVIVDGWGIYTRKDLIIEENVLPGTCESCKQSLHCTKFVNAQALFHPQCSCGKPVSAEDPEFRGHHWSDSCSAYLKQYPPFSAFVCQRCMYMALNHMPKDGTKCQRTICPATSCPHHVGSRAYAYELTKRRTLLLPQSQTDQLTSRQAW